LPVAMVATAAAALISVTQIASFNSYRPPPAGPPDAMARLISSSGVEPGFADLGWQWMGDNARIALQAAQKPVWIGFRAVSLNRARDLAVAVPGAAAFHVLIPAYHRHDPLRLILSHTFEFGPIAFPPPATSLALTAFPPAERPSTRDKRRLSLFLSSLRVGPSPLMVLPGQGFYPTETPSGGGPFNWMKSTAQIDVLLGSPTPHRYWLRFVGQSLTAGRTLVFRTPGNAPVTVGIPPLGESRPITVGPFVAPGASAQVTLTTPQPLASVATDPRLLGVQVGAPEALAAR